MKIAIISDIHDNLVNLENCLNWCNKNGIKEIICCGDITNSETLNFLASNFKNTIHLIKGNIELYNEAELEQYRNIKYYSKIGKIELESIVIGFCHEPYLAEKLARQGGYDIIFYGHTHKPWIEEKDEIKIINSGTLSAMFQKATFAVMEDDKIELKILENLGTGKRLGW